MKAARTARYCCILFAALFFCAAAAYAADEYPSKPGRLILPFGAGGSTDVVGRIFAQQFSEVWGQTLVVDNRAGTAGIIGTELGARAAPDGYTLFTYGINQAITPALYKKLPYMKALALPALQKRFFDNGVAAAPQTPAEFTKFVNVETAKWKKVVAISGAKIE